MDSNTSKNKLNNFFGQFCLILFPFDWGWLMQEHSAVASQIGERDKKLKFCIFVLFTRLTPPSVDNKKIIKLNMTPEFLEIHFFSFETVL